MLSAAVGNRSWAEIMEDEVRASLASPVPEEPPSTEERHQNIANNVAPESKPTPSKNLADNLNNVHLMTPLKEGTTPPPPVTAPIKFELEDGELEEPAEEADKAEKPESTCEPKTDLTVCPPPSPQKPQE